MLISSCINFIGANTENTSESQKSTLEALGKVIYMFDNFIGANTENTSELQNSTLEALGKVTYMFDNFIGANTKKVNYNTLVEQKPKPNRQLNY